MSKLSNIMNAEDYEIDLSGENLSTFKFPTNLRVKRVIMDQARGLSGVLDFSQYKKVSGQFLNLQNVKKIIAPQKSLNLLGSYNFSGTLDLSQCEGFNLEFTSFSPDVKIILPKGKKIIEEKIPHGFSNFYFIDSEEKVQPQKEVSNLNINSLFKLGRVLQKSY